MLEYSQNRDFVSWLYVVGGIRGEICGETIVHRRLPASEGIHPAGEGGLGYRRSTSVRSCTGNDIRVQAVTQRTCYGKIEHAVRDKVGAGVQGAGDVADGGGEDREWRT